MTTILPLESGGQLFINTRPLKDGEVVKLGVDEGVFLGVNEGTLTAENARILWWRLGEILSILPTDMEYKIARVVKRVRPVE